MWTASKRQRYCGKTKLSCCRNRFLSRYQLRAPRLAPRGRASRPGGAWHEHQTLEREMPSFAATGIPPDMDAWLGRGWEPERTYHTPRADASRSAKSSASGGRSTHPRAHWCDNSLQQERRAGWDSLQRTQVYGRPSSQPGLATASLRDHYMQRSVQGAGSSAQQTFPGPAHLGAPFAHAGFEPGRAVPGRQTGWRQGHSTKDARSAANANIYSMGRVESAAPLLMQGRVLAGGKPAILAEHHADFSYVSPDRALVGNEERTAMAMAIKRLADSLSA